MVAAFAAHLEYCVLLYVEPAGTTADEHLARRVDHFRLKIVNTAVNFLKLKVGPADHLWRAVEVHPDLMARF